MVDLVMKMQAWYNGVPLVVWVDPKQKRQATVYSGLSV